MDSNPERILAIMTYPTGHLDLGGGCHVWLQSDGGWGLNNAGLITGQSESMLVDTLFDTRLRHLRLRLPCGTLGSPRNPGPPAPDARRRHHHDC
jgi:hypothetical protein